MEAIGVVVEQHHARAPVLQRQRPHMRAEERELMPLAGRHLSAADWEEVEAAFPETSDPLLGAQDSARYDAFSSHIVNLSPPPIGVEPGRRPA